MTLSNDFKSPSDGRDWRTIGKELLETKDPVRVQQLLEELLQALDELEDEIEQVRRRAARGAAPRVLSKGRC